MTFQNCHAFREHEVRTYESSSHQRKYQTTGQVLRADPFNNTNLKVEYLKCLGERKLEGLYTSV